ncbi:hypothetical protein [Kitasatospora sp. NPDC096140]|uniref:hypothetical protein n=1 Tax=Kitasatospora sp. NPDC096140 TaxID=3155425 RepID=UPI0033244C0B
MWFMWSGVIVFVIVTVSRGFLLGGKQRAGFAVYRDAVAIGAGLAAAVVAYLIGTVMDLHQSVAGMSGLFWGLAVLEIAHYGRHRAHV